MVFTADPAKAFITQNDTGKYYWNLKEDGDIWVLTGATIKIEMRKVGAIANKITDGACVLESAALGRISYVDAGTNFDTPGQYRAYFEVTIATKRQSTRKVDIEIVEEW